ncbi:class I SAM-dependent methyltransferase [uncultured Cedecea sp.]|uniref:class I SAM-dependent methyltransferase n=1 Tax=uncultured Cedecea sp. TaxID=988762 RepID=UPI0026069E69|nr:class I SAM-dependent methyltransferase [uncultured Cedecea sp.]
MSLKTPDQLLHSVTNYWTDRAPSYSEANQEELASIKRAIWQNLLLSHVPDKQSLRVLDIGTGPGFFAIIMAQAGHKVTAVDATVGMLEQAESNARHYNVDIDFVESDVHSLPFDEHSFDVIVTRNVTWNLKKPHDAYQEWYRVLKTGGRLINFDANWYLHLFDDVYKAGFERDRNNTTQLGIPDHYINTDTVAMTKIAELLPLSRTLRPQWDAKTLLDIGFTQCLINTRIGEKVWDQEEKINYGSTPMFMIVAEK